MQAERELRSARWLLVISMLIGVLTVAGCGAGTGELSASANDVTLSATAAATTAATPTLSFTPVPGSPTPQPSPTLSLLAGRPSIGDPFTPDLGNTGYDVEHYELQVAVDPAASWVSGVTTITAVTTMPNLRQLSLDFAGFDIESVTLGDAPVAFQREGEKLFVDLEPPLLSEGTPFQLQVSYAGQPLQDDSPYIHYADYLGIVFPGNNTFYTLSEPDGAHYWFPCNDHPLDRATYHVELTIPRGLAGISNGRLLDTELSTMPDGSDGTTFIWEHDYPLATYLVLVGGGHYLRVEEESPAGSPLVFYYFPELEEDYMDAVDITGEAIDWLSELLGPYPFESYGQASYYAMGISMEMQTMTLLSYQMLDERTVVHELSHSWFGNWVALESWSDTWLKEGLATYMEVIWLSRDDPAERERLIAEIEAEVVEKGHDYPLNRPPRERVLSFDSYYRGALLMHALHEELGDALFFEGLRYYLARYGGGNATSEEFQTAMEAVAGHSLDPIFSEWLE